MAKKVFNIGDRVKCKHDSDKGTITRKAEAPHCWWVVWDGDGELYIDEDSMKLVKSAEEKARRRMLAKLLPYVSLDDSELNLVDLANAIAGRVEDDFAA